MCRYGADGPHFMGSSTNTISASELAAARVDMENAGYLLARAVDEYLEKERQRRAEAPSA